MLSKKQTHLEGGSVCVSSIKWQANHPDRLREQFRHILLCMRHKCSSDEKQTGTPLLFFRKKTGAGCFVGTQSAAHITGAGDNVPGEGYGSEQPPFLIRRRTSPPQYDGTKSSSVTGTPERIFFAT